TPIWSIERNLTSKYHPVNNIALLAGRDINIALSDYFSASRSKRLPLGVASPIRRSIVVVSVPAKLLAALAAALAPAKLRKLIGTKTTKTCQCESKREGAFVAQ